jgi:hypothetical protein
MNLIQVLTMEKQTDEQREKLTSQKTNILSARLSNQTIRTTKN